MKQSYQIFTAALLASMSLAAAAQADAEGAWLEGEHDRELKADVKLNLAF